MWRDTVALLVIVLIISGVVTRLLQPVRLAVGRDAHLWIGG